MASVQRLLKARATLRDPRPVPSPLEEDDRLARRWAQGVQPLRIFASRPTAGRLRVGVIDPAAAIDRLEVVSLEAGEAVLLTRAESEAVGRNEYIVPEGARGAFEVRGYMLIAGQQLLITCARLSRESEPAALSGPRRPQRVGQPAQGQRPPSADTLGVAWWWFLIAGVAAGLVGAAAWQETRH